MIYETLLRHKRFSHRAVSPQLNVVIAAYTAKAAIKIDGTTLHSLLGIPTGNWTTLSNTTLLKFIKFLSDLKFLTIDEISFVGVNFFEKIHQYNF